MGEAGAIALRQHEHFLNFNHTGRILHNVASDVALQRRSRVSAFFVLDDRFGVTSNVGVGSTSAGPGGPPLSPEAVRTASYLACLDATRRCRGMVASNDGILPPLPIKTKT